MLLFEAKYYETGVERVVYELLYCERNAKLTTADKLCFGVDWSVSAP